MKNNKKLVSLCTLPKFEGMKYNEEELKSRVSSFHNRFSHVI